MHKPKTSTVFEGARLYLSKHSPEILVGLGIAGMITTTILAVKATPKATKLIEIKKKEEQKEKLTPMETVKTTWKCYAPAAISGVTSVACLIGANSAHTRRNAALATAYKLSETAFNEYREKVVETIGEKKEQVVHDKIAADRIAKNPVNTSEIIVTDTGTTRLLDGVSGRRFMGNLDQVKKAVNEINYRITTNFCGYASLSDFYDELGLEHTDISDDIGWSAQKGLLTLNTSAQIDTDGVPCIVLSYNVMPEWL